MVTGRVDKFIKFGTSNLTLNATCEVFSRPLRMLGLVRAGGK